MSILNWRQLHLNTYGSPYCHYILIKDTLSLRKVDKILGKGETDFIPTVQQGSKTRYV